MNPSLFPPRAGEPAVCHQSGFSLVEVTLALGIMGFALVSLMGLLPLGLSTFRSSMNNSTGAQIAQRLINEAEQTDFSTLIATLPTVRYFDDQANELTAANKAKAIYDTNLVVVAGTTLPGAATANANLATVVIQVASNPGNQAIVSGTNNQWTTTVGVTISSYAVNVARNE